MKALWGIVDLADLLHLLLPLLLLFPEFALAGDIAAIAFCGDVFGDGADRFSGNDLAADRRLDRHFEELLRDHLHQLCADRPPFLFGFSAVDEAGEGIDRLFVHSDLEFDDIAFFIVIELIIEGAVAAW